MNRRNATACLAARMQSIGFNVVTDRGDIKKI